VTLSARWYPALTGGRWLAAGLLLAALLTHACVAGNPRPEQLRYRVAFQATLTAGDPEARITITVDQASPLLKSLDFNIDPALHSGFSASGEWRVADGRLLWMVPAGGGVLSYRARIPHQRSPGRYDAWLAKDWALFRGDDLFPAARVRSSSGAAAVSTVQVNAPAGWSVVTPYGSGAGSRLDVQHQQRRFDRPTGWMLAGNLGVRRERIGPTETVVAGPVGQNVRRQDMLALLHWTLPTLDQLFGALPRRLLIVSAGDPMWRGGLSGPDSLFIHADRPLISENGTSSLVHELVHVVLGVGDRSNEDWLVEGVAEYYALEVLRRSNTISERRYALAHQQLADWGADVTRLNRQESRGKVTARAVGLLKSLNQQLLSHGSSLDLVINNLRDEGAPFSALALAAAASAAAGSELPAFRAELDALLGEAG
jgi:hypothetical protein